MKIIVLKFGGTSVGTTDRIKKVVKIIAKYKKKYNVIVLSSAMSGVTTVSYTHLTLPTMDSV